VHFFFFGGVGVKASLATPRCRVNDYYSNSTLSHTLKAEDDSGYNVEMTPTGTDDGVDPALDLVRTMSMSTDKDILKQLRDAMNPKQKQQTWIMMFQAFMGMVAVLVLLVVVIVGYVSLRQVRESVQTMAEQTEQLKQITLQTTEQMEKLVANLDPVSVLPEFKESLDNMNTGVYELTTTLCGSPIFASNCPKPETPGPPSPAPVANSTGFEDAAPAPAPDMIDSSASG